MRKNSNRNLTEIAAVLAILCGLASHLLAEEYNFTGTWQGRLFDEGGSEYGVGCSSGCGPIILRVAEVNKEKGTSRGKFTTGGLTEDIREAKFVGNKLTFKTGVPPAPQINDYEAILDGEYLKVTWTPEWNGVRGRQQTFTQMRSK